MSSSYSSAAVTQSVPPAILKLLAHELRWQLVALLAKSDRRVQELVEMLGRPPNLVSYHLRHLRKGGVLHEQRSAADKRDVYYSLDLDKLRSLCQASGVSLHPALGESTVDVPPALANQGASWRVLFLCTENSARSQIAEGLLRELSQGQVEADSAGSVPSIVHPIAIETMAKRGIDISQQYSKSMDEFSHQKFDFIITVCDKVRETCPVFPHDPEQIHWSTPDPVSMAKSTKEMHQLFEKTALELSTRINYFLIVLAQKRKENV